MSPHVLLLRSKASKQFFYSCTGKKFKTCNALDIKILKGFGFLRQLFHQLSSNTKLIFNCFMHLILAITQIQNIILEVWFSLLKCHSFNFKSFSTSKNSAWYHFNQLSGIKKLLFSIDSFNAFLTMSHWNMHCKPVTSYCWKRAGYFGQLWTFMLLKSPVDLSQIWQRKYFVVCSLLFILF